MTDLEHIIESLCMVAKDESAFESEIKCERIKDQLSRVGLTEDEIIPVIGHIVFTLYNGITPDEIDGYEEVRHGEWEEVTTNAIDDLAFDTVASMRCSKCDRYHNRVYHYGDPTEMEHYCSFCGAKMDGGTQ